ncbi:alpha/beta hydrolase [Alloalcanivorax gelatiniphagus]|uniref:Alpha/beta hydrolase n=2 Tax=Alloalcanivorax gelatiniphagus TaxID=1194167 RepID=A0ABY2XJA3_9GAMM|nr:alpha/beta hydrolase [Alloalcanivorax gelatiniphagus]
MVGSVRTSYLCSGSGAPVVCLHGAGAGAVTWYPTMGALSRHFQVIVPDIVGFGESDKPDAPYDRAFFAGWLKGFLAELAVSRAHLVGLSQGGAIALQFVLDNPEMVDRLVLVDAGGLGAKASLRSLLGMLWLNNFPSGLANRFYSRFILFNPANRDPDHARYSVAVLKGDGGKKAFRQGKGAAVSKIPESALRRITHDALIIWGEDDKLFPLGHGEAASKLLPNASFVRISKAGHLPLMDQPDIFNDAVVGFLTEGKWSKKQSPKSHVSHQAATPECQWSAMAER